MSTALKPAESTAAPVVTDEPGRVMALLQSAVERGMDTDSLTALVQLQERIMDRIAAAAFHHAINAFQRDVPVIQHNRSVKNRDGSVRYSYATLDQVVATIKPYLDRHGLSYGFSQEYADGRMTVLCTVSHVDGHSTDTPFSCPVDKDAYMNDAQKDASATSFACRRALLLALGLVTANEDDDGAALGTCAPITDSQAADLRAMIEETGADERKFCAWAKVDRIEDISAEFFPRAVKALDAKRRRQ